MSTAWGGGGGGFGGMPYRSAHQQGTDGRRRGGGRGHRRRRNKPRRKPPALLCAADVYVKANCRGLLIGKGGCTIKQLRASTKATIFVPNKPQQNNNRRNNRRSNNNNNESNSNNNNEQEDNRPVRIKAESVASLLHVCWRIITLPGLTTGSADEEEEEIACHIRIPSNGPSLVGRLSRQAQFLVGGNGSSDDQDGNNGSPSTAFLSAYCVESFLDFDEVETLVDNERFADASVAAQCETVYQEDEGDSLGQPSTLIFVFGSSEQKPDVLYRALYEATLTMWRRQNLEQGSIQTKQPQQQEDKVPPDAITVATYNVLYPTFAERYQEQAGLWRTGKSNLALRAPAIACLLLQHNLDIYLLQEVENEAFQEIPSLMERYEFVSFVHPGRDGDSVALLIRKDRFVVEQTEQVPFRHKDDPSQPYMCAATALIRDAKSNHRYLVASTHFYTKRCLDPQDTLLEYLAKHQSDCDAILWGGDCNDEYNNGSFPAGYETVHDSNDDEGDNPRFTRQQKRIDWILHSSGKMTSWRSSAANGFVEATKEVLEPTGYPPSDHFAEAITLLPRGHGKDVMRRVTGHDVSVVHEVN